MRIGLSIADPATAIADARAAEDMGFDLVGSGEHLFFHGPVPNAFTTLAAAAGATERIGLVSSVALLPLYPAALLAKLAVTLDIISGGRFELGVGAGGEYPREFEAAGIDPATRFARVDEGLAVIRQLFTGGRVSFDGTYNTLSGVALNPPPVRPGGPPIWLGGRGPGALRRAGTYADVWMPYMVDPAKIGDGLASVRGAAVAAGRAQSDVSAALFVWTAVDRDADWARTTGVATVSAAYQQDFSTLADRYLLIGDPARVVDRIGEFAAAGVETVLIQVAAADRADRNRIVATLAEHVIPAVRG